MSENQENQEKQEKKVLTPQQSEEYFGMVLAERFVKSEEVSSILNFAFQSKKNVLLWGPAGHGKSEMVEHMTTSVFGKDNVYIESFGEGMDEDKLWGGLDFRHLDEEKEMRFNVENSFLNAKCAVFEEIFDAPAVVLLSLKDTLTAKELRKGPQRFPMKARTIIGTTNKEPDEISELGPSAHALIERFPLQLNVKWDTYKTADYLEMFNKVEKKRGFSQMKKTLAGICESAVEKGGFISPRTAIHALQLCMINKWRGNDCYNVLRFVPGFECVMDTIQQDLLALEERRKAAESLLACQDEFESLKLEIETNEDDDKMNELENNMKALLDKVFMLPMHDSIVSERQKLNEEISEFITQIASREHIEQYENLNESLKSLLTMSYDKDSVKENRDMSQMLRDLSDECHALTYAMENDSPLRADVMTIIDQASHEADMAIERVKQIAFDQAMKDE